MVRNKTIARYEFFEKTRWDSVGIIDRNRNDKRVQNVVVIVSVTGRGRFRSAARFARCRCLSDRSPCNYCDIIGKKKKKNRATDVEKRKKKDEEED